MSVSLSLCVSMYMCDAVLGGEVDHPQRWLQKEIEIIGCRPGRVNVRCVCVCVCVCVYTLSQMAAKMEKACRDSGAVRYVCALHALNKSKIKRFTHLKHFTHITYFTHQIFHTSNISNAFNIPHKSNISHTCTLIVVCWAWHVLELHNQTSNIWHTSTCQIERRSSISVNFSRETHQLRV